MLILSIVGPEQVIISGSTEARFGESVSLTCSTAPSNPPAEIKWTVTGKQYKNATMKTTISPDGTLYIYTHIMWLFDYYKYCIKLKLYYVLGGWITSSNITVAVEANRRSIVVVCHGLNMQLAENVLSTHTINVLCKCYLFQLIM